MATASVISACTLSHMLDNAVVAYPCSPAPKAAHTAAEVINTVAARQTEAALAAPAILGAQSPNDTMRVAFIGVGNRGSYLLRHMVRVAGTKVVAVCDLLPERAEKVGRILDRLAIYHDRSGAPVGRYPPARVLQERGLANFATSHNGEAVVFDRAYDRL